MSTPAPRPAGTGAGGVSNPAFRPEPAVRPGSNVGIGKPASGSGAASRRPGSDEFSDHPDDRDFKQQQRKRTYIILAVMGFFILAFLVISIVMIVLYANEKNKPDPEPMTKEMIKAKPFFFSYVDYTTSYTEHDTLNDTYVDDIYTPQIRQYARAAFPPSGNWAIPSVVANHGELVKETNSNPIKMRAVVSSTIILAMLSPKSKSSRQLTIGPDGFPDERAFKEALNDQMYFNATVIANITVSPSGICKDYLEPTEVSDPNELFTVAPTTTNTSTISPGSPSSPSSPGTPSSPGSTGPTFSTAATGITDITGSSGSTISGESTPTNPPTTLPSGASSTQAKTTQSGAPTTTFTCTPCPTQSSATTCPPCSSTSSPLTSLTASTFPSTSCPSCPTCTPATITTTKYNPTTRTRVPPPSTTTKSPLDDSCILDVVFILDESESVGAGDNGRQNFQLIKKAMQYAIDPEFLSVSPDETRVAWVGFSTRAWTESDQVQLLKDTVDFHQTFDAIGRISFHPGGSNAYEAFRYAQDVILTKENGDRLDPQVTNKYEDILILISDGNYGTWDDPIPASSVAIQLMERGVQSYAVAVAEDQHSVDFNNLMSITSLYNNDTSRIYNISKYEDLAEKLHEIIHSRDCRAPPTLCRGDLVLVVDRSESVGDANFRELQKFLVTLTNLFVVDGQKQNRIALVTYSRDVKVEFDLNTFDNNKDIADYIRNKLVYYHPDATNTGGALQVVLDQIFTQETGDRICSDNIVILFTDGIHDVGPPPSVPAAALWDQKRATIVSVGIGPAIETAELDSISAPSHGRVYNYTTFDVGLDFVDYVNNITCQPDPVMSRCSDKKDIAFVVDVNSGLSEADFQNLKDYLAYLADSFYMDDQDQSIYVSMVTYGSDVVDIIPLRHYSNKDFSDIIAGLKQDTHTGPPALGEALRTVKTSIYNSASDRPDTDYPDVVIIIETQPTWWTQMQIDWADQLTADGYTKIVGIAAGDSSHDSFNALAYLAGSSDSVAYFPSVDDLKLQTCVNNDETQRIQSLVCGWYPPPPPPPTSCYTICSDSTPPTTPTTPPPSTRRPPPTHIPTTTGSSPSTTRTTPTTTRTTPTTTRTSPATTKTSQITTRTTSTSTRATTAATTNCPNADLVFVVDVSDSPNHYIPILKQFVANISQRYFENSRNSRVAVVTFSEKSWVVINLDAGSSYDAVLNAINSAAWVVEPSWRDTNLGLQTARDRVLNSVGNRPAIPDKVIVVDFGQYTASVSDEPFTTADEIRGRSDTTVYGFGSKPLEAKLRDEDPLEDLTRIVGGDAAKLRHYDNIDLLVNPNNLREMLNVLGCANIEL